MLSLNLGDESLCGEKLNLDLVSDILYRTANYYNFNTIVDVNAENNSTTSGTVDWNRNNSDNNTAAAADVYGAEKICGRFCDILGLPSNKCKLYRSMNTSSISDLIREIMDKANKSKVPKECRELNNIEICDSSFVYRLLVGYFFPALLTICICGNFLNLLVYTTKDLRKSSTVKMLMAKSVVNILFMLFLLPLCLLLLNDSQSTVIDEARLWKNWPYFMFFSNIAGTCAAWLTVMMTFERYLFVTYPLRSRQWCTTRNFFLSLLVVFCISCLVYIEIPLAREAESIYCKNKRKYIHKLYIKTGKPFQTWERVFYWTTVCWHGILPIVILTFCTFRIAYQLLYRTMPTSNAERKQCVTRITMATTICHLVLESPAIAINIVAAFYGPTFMMADYTMCVCSSLTNLASQLNASICCLIYLSCSDKYRSILFGRLNSIFCNKSPVDLEEVVASAYIKRNSLRCPMLLNSTSNCHTQTEDLKAATPV